MEEKKGKNDRKKENGFVLFLNSDGDQPTLLALFYNSFFFLVYY